MKSQYQVLKFLSQFSPSSDIDKSIIVAFLEKQYRVTPKTSIFAPEPTETIIDSISFAKWYKNDYAPCEIAIYEGFPVILGTCNLTSAEIKGTLELDTVKPTSTTVPYNTLQKAPEEEKQRFLKAMYNAKLQFNPAKLELEPKYIPFNKDKVFFHSYDLSINGVGVANMIERYGEKISFFCYFIYPTKTEEGKVGFSMNEDKVATLHEYIFEPIDDNHQNRFSPEDGISAYRRLKREIEKKGKIWRDKLYRIEPKDMRVEVGEKYFYITDKLGTTNAIEKGTPTSKERYCSGNYFKSEKAADIMQSKLKQLILGYLASEGWPELPDDFD